VRAGLGLGGNSALRLGLGLLGRHCGKFDLMGLVWVWGERVCLELEMALGMVSGRKIDDNVASVGESQVKRRVRKEREGTRGGRAREGGLFICEGRGLRQSAQSLTRLASADLPPSPPPKPPFLVPDTSAPLVNWRVRRVPLTTVVTIISFGACRPGGCYLWPELPPPHFRRRVQA
jgi:hypothetical protein